MAVVTAMPLPVFPPPLDPVVLSEDTSSGSAWVPAAAIDSAGPFPGGSMTVELPAPTRWVCLPGKQTHLVGAGNSTVIDPPGNGPALSIAAAGTQADPLLVSSLRTTGSSGGGNTGSGIAVTTAISDVTVAHVRSTDNTGHGFAVNNTGSVTRLRLDTVDFSSNDGDGLRFPTSMAGLDGLTVLNSHF